MLRLDLKVRKKIIISKQLESRYPQLKRLERKWGKMTFKHGIIWAKTAAGIVVKTKQKKIQGIRVSPCVLSFASPEMLCDAPGYHANVIYTTTNEGRKGSNFYFSKVPWENLGIVTAVTPTAIIIKAKNEGSFPILTFLVFKRNPYLVVELRGNRCT